MSAPALHHNPFARRSPSAPARSTGRRSLPPVRSTTFNYDQAAVRSRGMGFPRFGCCVLPADSVRLGWSYASSSEFIEFDRLTKAGVEDRVAAQILTNHSGAQSHFQCIPERYDHSSKPLRLPILDSHDANENGLTHAQIAFAPGAKTHV